MVLINRREGGSSPQLRIPTLHGQELGELAAVTTCGGWLGVCVSHKEWRKFFLGKNQREKKKEEPNDHMWQWPPSKLWPEIF